MKRKTVIEYLGIICLTLLFISCDDKEENDQLFSSELNGMYSNKSAASSTKDPLLLTYNGENVYGKEAYFSMASENSADVTLFGILPGEKELTLANVSLDKKEEGYRFNGTGLSENGTYFDYKGEIEEGKLTFELENVKVKDNRLTEPSRWELVQAGATENLTDDEGAYRYYHRSFYLIWDPVPQGSIIIGQVPNILRTLVEKIVYSTLKDVTFSIDGNVTATYATFPDTFDFMEDFFVGEGFPNRPAEDWNHSSRNLVNYYVKDNKVYVVPNAEMIIREIRKETRATRAEGNLFGIDIDFDTIKDAYVQITEWCTTGLELEVRPIETLPAYEAAENRRVQYEGDLMLILNKDELEPLLPLLSLVKGLLSEEVLNQMAPIGGGLTVGELIDVIMDGLLNSDRFELGICLNKA